MELILMDPVPGDRSRGIEANSGAKIPLLRPPYKSQGLYLGILGNMGSGKSWTLGVLAEEAHRIRLPFIYYDIDGDAASLGQLGEDVIKIGHKGHSDPLRRAHYDLHEAIRDATGFIEWVMTKGFNLVIDLSDRDEEEIHIGFQDFMAAHYRLGEAYREPTLVIVDEAHEFAPQRRATDYQGASQQVFLRCLRNGRKRGINLAIATQRSTFLDKNILFGMNIRLFGLTTMMQDFKAVRDYLPPKVGPGELAGLDAGEYYIVSAKRHGLIRIKGRRTRHLGETPMARLSKRTVQPRPSIESEQLRLPLKVR